MWTGAAWCDAGVPSPKSHVWLASGMLLAKRTVRVSWGSTVMRSDGRMVTVTWSSEDWPHASVTFRAKTMVVAPAASGAVKDAASPSCDSPTETPDT